MRGAHCWGVVEASRAGGADVGSFFGLDPEVYSLQRFVDTCVFYLVCYIRCEGIYGGGRGTTTVLVGGVDSIFISHRGRWATVGHRAIRARRLSRIHENFHNSVPCSVLNNDSRSSTASLAVPECMASEVDLC